MTEHVLAGIYFKITTYIHVKSLEEENSFVRGNMHASWTINFQ